MTTTTMYLRRMVSCITYGRLAQVLDAGDYTETDTFWEKTTYHLVVCYRCESLGALSATSEWRST